MARGAASRLLVCLALASLAAVAACSTVATPSPSPSPTPGVAVLDIGPAPCLENEDPLAGPVPLVLRQFFGLPASTPSAPVVADVDGDGHLDIVVPGFRGGATVLFGRGDGCFDGELLIVPANWSVALADVLGSGDPALILTEANGHLAIVPTQADRTFGTALDVDSGLQSALSVAAARLDDDAIVDLVVAAESLPEIAVLRGLGGGTFAKPALLRAGPGTNAVAATDLDGDGDVDLVTAGLLGAMRILMGQGNGSFADPVEYSYLGTSPPPLALGDANGDGNTDVLIAGSKDFRMALFLGHGDGTFEPAQEYATGNTLSVAIADIDGDGHADLLAGSPHPNEILVYVWRGIGGSEFQATDGIEIPTRSGRIAVADLNEDGRFDLVVSNESSLLVSIFLGRS